MKWMFYRENWRRTVTTNLDFASEVGIRVADYLDKRQRREDTSAIFLPKTLALAPESKALQKRFDGIGEIMRRLTTVLERDYINRFEILATELVIPEAGNCRIDAVIRREDGDIGVLDVKTVFTTSDYMVQKRIVDAEYSWQAYHYVWALGAFTDYRPTYFVFAFIRATEKPELLVEPYTISPDYFDFWKQSAFQTWADMEALEKGDRPITMNPLHRGPYGECEFKTACLHHDGLIHLDDGYMQLKRRKNGKNSNQK